MRVWHLPFKPAVKVCLTLHFRIMCWAWILALYLTAVSVWGRRKVFGTSAEDAPNAFIFWWLNIKCITDYFSFFLKSFAAFSLFSISHFSRLVWDVLKGWLSDRLVERPPAFVVGGTSCCWSSNWMEIRVSLNGYYWVRVSKENNVRVFHSSFSLTGSCIWALIFGWLGCSLAVVLQKCDHICVHNFNSVTGKLLQYFSFSANHQVITPIF